MQFFPYQHNRVLLALSRHFGGRVDQTAAAQSFNLTHLYHGKFLFDGGPVKYGWSWIPE